MEPISFRQFMELEEKEKNMFTSLFDDLGIPPKAWKGIPNPASFFKLGDTFNLAAYKITGFDDEEDPTHVKVQVFDDLNMPRKRYKKQKGKFVRVPDDEEDKPKTVSVPQIQDLIVQALKQQAPPEMGGLPGGGELPGMGMGM
jgi:hypothetical protein